MSDFTRPPGRSVADVLQRWIYGGHFTADELADAGEVSSDAFAKYRSGERNCPAEVAARISRYAMQRRGRTEMAALFCDAGHVVTAAGAPAPNGDIRDEITAVVGSLGDAHRHFTADELDEAEHAAVQIGRQARAIQDEISLRRGRTGR